MTPGLSGNGGNGVSTPIKMDSCGDLLAGSSSSGFFGIGGTGGSSGAGNVVQQPVRDERVDELLTRVYDLEGKLATLSESYELVCTQALGCKKELAGYSDVMTHVVSLLATMAQKDESAIQAQLNNLAKVSIEHLNNSSNSGCTNDYNHQTPITLRDNKQQQKSNNIKKRKRRNNDYYDDIDEEDDDIDAESCDEQQSGEEINTINETEEEFEFQQQNEEEEEEEEEEEKPIVQTKKRSKKKGKHGATSTLSLLTPPIGNHGKVPGVKEGRKPSRAK
ncbi:UNVERIFIED_CONTAM: hypothetical protein HDU68_007846 [Siphonaria sp. JEL0065]|nr:hypothetical protein HDU68_007846 [Siphonaria sp. JEL0065]